MTTRTKYRINVILTAEQYNALKEKAERAGESMATMIRRALERAAEKSNV